MLLTSFIGHYFIWLRIVDQAGYLSVFFHGPYSILDVHGFSDIELSYRIVRTFDCLGGGSGRCGLDGRPRVAMLSQLTLQRCLC